jgi:hypothetical protein
MDFTTSKAFIEWKASVKAGNTAEQAFHDSVEDIEIPPFLRKLETGTHEGAQWMVSRIDHRVARLAALGLHPHPQVLENRQHCIDFLNGTSGVFDIDRFTVRRML